MLDFTSILHMHNSSVFVIHPTPGQEWHKAIFKVGLVAKP